MLLDGDYPGDLEGIYVKDDLIFNGLVYVALFSTQWHKVVAVNFFAQAHFIMCIILLLYCVGHGQRSRGMRGTCPLQ